MKTKTLAMLSFGLLVGAAWAQEAKPVDPTQPPPLRFIFNMIHDNPGETPFETKYRDPAIVKALGYTGQVMKAFPQTALTYDVFDPDVVPKGSPERAWAEEYGKTVDRQIAAAKAAGLPIYNFTDVLVVPEKLLAKYGNEMTVGKGNVTKEIVLGLCAAQPACNPC
jgi:hypothetical protein